jgi:hypothetical protein
MNDLAELKAELRWLLAQETAGPRTEMALKWALDVLDELEEEVES